jgi:RHS repeat-associated protein
VVSTYRSVRDEVVAVDEVNQIGGVNNIHLVTRYAYDPLSEVVSISDANENVTTAAYDTDGQMVALTSPDAGRTEWRYDRAGNAAVKETANLRAAGQLVNYVYNDDRLEKIVYPTSPNVAFTYGGSGETGASNGFVAGRVKTRVDESGEIDFRYDGLGNVVQEATTFVNERLPKKPYINTMTYSYDTFGRMLEMQFPGPGAEIVRYGYDAGGEVTSARGLNTVSKANKPPLETVYLQHIGYDEFGQRTRMLLGNGIPTTYQYEQDTRRLAQVNTDYRDSVQVAQGIGPLPMQRLRYAYDLVGNVRSLANVVPPEKNDASVVVGPTGFAFDYDRLSQLTHVDGTYQDHVATRLRHSMDLAYDRIGNVTQKNQQDFQDTGGISGTFQPGPARPQTTYLLGYQYGGPSPHAVTHIDEALQGNVSTPRDVAHDSDGNQAGWTFKNGITRVQVWDEEDRLRSVTDQGHVVGQYLYSSSGVRTHSFVDGDETIYPNQYLSIKNGSFFTQHIYAGETRIASKVNSDSLSNPDTLWYHTDSLRDTQFVSDANQTLVQHLEYFASGETWKEESTDAFEPFRPAYQFNGNELDTKTGYYYFGARYYDPQVQNWQSADPALTSYLRGKGNAGIFAPQNLGLYTFGWNNPVSKTDPNGRIIVVADPAQRSYFQKLINSRASGDFKFDANNRLVKTSEKGVGRFLYRMLANAVNFILGRKYSSYYSDKLEAAINSPKTITLSQTLNYTVVNNGAVVNVDTFAGGGLTERLANGNQNVAISGNPLTVLKDTAGRPLRDDPADIVQHELVGHAIPHIIGPDTGNAVANENKARAQEHGAGQRAPDPTHNE